VAKPTVTLRFDDMQTSQYTLGFQRIKPYGVKAVFALILSRVGTNATWTLEQIREAYNYGCDIVSHAISHTPHLTQMPIEQAEYEISYSQKWLRDNGFYRGSYFIIPPFHDVNYEVAKFIMKYYYGIPYWTDGYNKQPIPKINWQLCFKDAMSSYDPMAWITWEQMKNILDTTIENEYYTILLWHAMREEGATLLEQTVQYCKDNDIRIATFSEMMPPPPPPPNPETIIAELLLAGATITPFLIEFAKNIKPKLEESLVELTEAVKWSE
jgi:peptidoglycan/xylan/chitin deacetylase (PgdA/CDA1 family)